MGYKYSVRTRYMIVPLIITRLRSTSLLEYKMRSSLLSSGLFLAGCALAAPRPQDIDFALADAIPNPTYATTQSVVTYDASAILESAMPQITSLDTSDALTTGVAKMIKRGACATQPAGAGPVPSPDSASAFVSYSSFSSQATSAPVPAGYSQTFKNLQASNNAYGYMGYTLLKSYGGTLLPNVSSGRHVLTEC